MDPTIKILISLIKLRVLDIYNRMGKKLLEGRVKVF